MNMYTEQLDYLQDLQAALDELRKAIVSPEFSSAVTEDKRQRVFGVLQKWIANGPVPSRGSSNNTAMANWNWLIVCVETLLKSCTYDNMIDHGYAAPLRSVLAMVRQEIANIHATV